MEKDAPDWDRFRKVGCRKALLQRLEPCAAKVASTVLRGRRFSNVLQLHDFSEATHICTSKI
ncbi:MAG: hypothetical protein NT163_05990 [Chlorobiales bacterium]|nr:hypothetical protein [Chlorobiales bacterium]